MLYIELAIVVALILLNGLLALAELAIVSSRHARLQALVDRQVIGSRRALALATDPGRFLSTVQIGITLVGVLSGAFAPKEGCEKVAAQSSKKRGWHRANQNWISRGPTRPRPLDALGGVLVFGASDTPSDGTECSARRRARASSTIAADRLGRRHQNKNDALRNTNGRQSHEIADPESLQTDVVGPYANAELIAMDQAFVAAVVRAIKAGDESAAAASATVRTER
jgi:Cyclin M transmembrane N-terminal domain